MDLNELLRTHQIAAMKAGAAGDDAGRRDHFASVALYAERIGALREQMYGAAQAPALIADNAVIYGTFDATGALPDGVDRSAAPKPASPIEPTPAR